MRDGGERHVHAIDGGDIIVVEVGDIQARFPLHLRNNLVGAAGEVEIIHVAAAQCLSQHGAHLRHVQPQRRGLVAVDDHGGLRLVEFKVAIQIHELAALERLLQQLLRERVELCEGIGGLDHELHREALGAGQRRQRERGHLLARIVGVSVGLHLLLQHSGIAALAPGLQHGADEVGARHVDLEGVSDVLVTEQESIELVIPHRLLRHGRIRRRGGGQEHHALVLDGGQLALRPGGKEEDAGEDDAGESDGHRHGIQADAEHAGIDMVQPGEGGVDEVDQPPLPIAAGAVDMAQEARAQHRGES